MKGYSKVKINYVNGDATDPKEYGTKIILHCCNDLGLWGAGFVLAISKKWKVEEAYRSWAETKEDKDSTFILGNYQLVSILPGSDIMVCNLIGQQGVKRFNGTPPIRYDALKKGMQSLSIILPLLPNASIHMPRMGCGLAGGRWEDMEPIIVDTLVKKGIPVTVYDFDDSSS